MEPLDVFRPETRAWFERNFAAPTPAQAQGWPAIAAGGHVLIQAPTGSGKTLAAFLSAIDRLTAAPGRASASSTSRRSRRSTTTSSGTCAARSPASGPELRVAVRTGDTPQKERAAMLREPPDILITTPESLFLLLTSRARELLRSVDTLILDEVHAVAGTKRGAHLALSVERLEALAAQPPQRIGLSATQRPLEEIGRFVSGSRAIELVDAGVAKELDLEVVVPVEDMREPAARSRDEGCEPRSIWPSIYPALVELVRAHRSTIVFVNNRRLAERLALRLNELAEEEIARAHHGSLAREQRTQIEEDLKAGRIPCLVATSSLELGIDMGAVDLVIQVESPKSVARGLQRIGRAGHSLGEVSRGRIFPKFRADLLESAVVAQRMRAGLIEETQIPRNPLDVLAQQIVAICADEEIEVARAARARPPRLSVRRPLARAARERPRHARGPLPVGRVRRAAAADRLGPHGRRRPRAAGRAAARRHERRHDPRPRALRRLHRGRGAAGRVGELDEEMVYEARAGQVIVLGASSWRIEEITRDRVLVSPAPGVPGAVPFWKGEGIGRPYELGEAIGKFARELLAASRAEGAGPRRARRAEPRRVPPRAGDGDGAVPSDRTVVVERFRDEIGDWRVCILTPFGARVHAPWAMAVGARLRESLGLEVQSIWSDDGIAFHLPDADSPPATDLLMLDPDELEELVLAEVGQTALFGARFRENAARALLIPRRRPGERTPLWQQRLKAQGLLQVARKYSSFPIVLETYRECLQDVFDLPALKRLLGRLRAREIDLVDVETATASPFASSLLFDYIATYMYEDDTPPAERRAQALSLDRDLLRELLGQEELRELIDPAALAEVEASLRPFPQDPERLHDLLRLRGDLAWRVRRGARRDPRGASGARSASASPARSGSRRRGCGPLPRRARRRAAVGPAGRVPRARAGCAALARGALGARPRAVHDRRGVGVVRRRRRGGAARARARRRSSSAASSARAAASASGAIPTSCGGCAGRRSRPCAARSSRWSRRRSAASCRAGTASTAARRCARRSSRCRRSRCRWRCGRRRCCRGAFPATGPSSSTSSAPRASSSGSAPGSTASPSSSATTRRCSDVPPPRLLRTARRTRRFARRSPAARSSGTGSSARPGSIAETALPALVGSRLERRGDERLLVAAARRAALPAAAARPARAPLLPARAHRPTATQGRWSLAAQLFAGGEPDRRALAELLLERHGIVTRDAVRAEGIPGGYGAVYGELRALETLGSCRRGYFVEGLGGAQFALGGAVERLRELRPRDGDEPEPLVLAAADPAQPYGAVLPWPKRAGARAARVAGAHVVLLGGEPALFVERGGRSLVPLREPDEDWLRPALAALVGFVKRGGAKRLAVERFDGEPVTETLVMPLLVEAGFLAGPRRAVLRA